MDSGKILIIGVLPPPIGGISIHVQRLIRYLNVTKYPFLFVDYKKNNIFTQLRAIKLSHVIHLHTCNPILNVFYVFCSLCLRKKSIWSIHGEYDCYSYYLNKIK